MFGAISEKFRTFDIQIIFAIPPIFHFSQLLGGILFLFSKLRNFYHFINQLVRKVENFLGISRQSLNYAHIGMSFIYRGAVFGSRGLMSL